MQNEPYESIQDSITRIMGERLGYIDMCSKMLGGIEPIPANMNEEFINGLIERHMDYIEELGYISNK